MEERATTQVRGLLVTGFLEKGLFARWQRRISISRKALWRQLVEVLAKVLSAIPERRKAQLARRPISVPQSLAAFCWRLKKFAQRNPRG